MTVAIAASLDDEIYFTVHPDSVLARNLPGTIASRSACATPRTPS
jgi:hypothetical protein